MINEKIKNILELITQCNQITITTHIKPDGDAIGSVTAFGLFLKKLGKQVKIINEHGVPHNYLFLTKYFEIEVYKKEIHSEFILNSDLIFVLDANRFERFPALTDDIKNSKAKIICIDHHIEPEDFYDFELIDTEAAATGELIYNIISTFDINKLDLEIAISLYTAILTDTGSFRFASTKPETHNIASKLISYGINPNDIYRNIFEQDSLNKIQLISRALSSMQLLFDGKVSIFGIERKDFIETNTTDIDVENIINFGLNVKDVNLTMLFSELENKVKIGFRSKGNIPVNLLAREFGGGGHLNASSASIKNVTLMEAKNMILNKINKYLN